MKDLMKRGMSFVTFERPLQAVHISTQFARIHTSQQQKIPKWSTTATRQKLIAHYWYRSVVQHFVMLHLLPVATVFFISGHKQPDSFLLAVLSTGLLCYLLLYFVLYRNHYASNFLPVLEVIKESYEVVKNEDLPQCRQEQLSTFSLVLIFYVLDKTSNINAIRCNQKFSNQLMKMYGRSPEGVYKVLAFLFGKKKDFGSRKSTEVEQDFEDAYTFFEEMDFQEGIIVLKAFEQKIRERYQQSA